MKKSDAEAILEIVYRKTDPYTRLTLIESFCKGQTDHEELPVELRILTALVEPINDAICNLLEDQLIDNIMNTLREEGKLTGCWEEDQALAEQVHFACLEIIGERFKKA